jgi:hypothetical protein
VSCLALSCFVLPCLILSCVALPCLALSGLVLPCLELSCLVFSCRVMSCLALFCFALPCLALALPCLTYLCVVIHRKASRMQLSQADRLLELQARERQLWNVASLPKLSLAVGGALYIVWSDEDKAGKTKPHPFQGDLRIVRKERTEKKNTIFMFKDGTTRACLTAHVKNMVVTSNHVLASTQSAIVFAKKLTHVEEPRLLDSDSSEDDTGQSSSSDSADSGEEISDEDGEDEETLEDTTTARESDLPSADGTSTYALSADTITKTDADTNENNGQGAETPLAATSADSVENTSTPYETHEVNSNEGLRHCPRKVLNLHCRSLQRPQCLLPQQAVPTDCPREVSYLDCRSLQRNQCLLPEVAFPTHLHLRWERRIRIIAATMYPHHPLRTQHRWQCENFVTRR